MILTTDLHLTDRPEEDYRWEVFSFLRDAMARHGDREVGILGDMLDRRDRHAGALLNRVVRELTGLEADSIIIIMGNHDMPLAGGAPYWEFLNEVPPVTYVTEPAEIDGALWLPFAREPVVEWEELDLAAYRRIFMHQTVVGARMENGQLATSGLPVDYLPAGADILSGDIHVPQKRGPVTYIGAPHAIHYGDGYPTAVTLLRPDGTRFTQRTTPQQRIMLELESVEKLATVLAAPWIAPGASVRIRIKMKPEDVAQWPHYEAQALAVARKYSVNIRDIVWLLEEQPGQVTEVGTNTTLDLSPAAALEAFATHEGIRGSLLDAARRIANLPPAQAPAQAPEPSAAPTGRRPRPRAASAP